MSFFYMSRFTEVLSSTRSFEVFFKVDGSNLFCPQEDCGHSDNYYHLDEREIISICNEKNISFQRRMRMLDKHYVTLGYIYPNGVRTFKKGKNVKVNYDYCKT